MNLQHTLNLQHLKHLRQIEITRKSASQYFQGCSQYFLCIEREKKYKDT